MQRREAELKEEYKNALSCSKYKYIYWSSVGSSVAYIKKQ